MLSTLLVPSANGNAMTRRSYAKYILANGKSQPMCVAVGSKQGRPHTGEFITPSGRGGLVFVHTSLARKQEGMGEGVVDVV